MKKFLFKDKNQPPQNGKSISAKQFSISAERFFILRKNFLRIQILVKQIFMCFLKTYSH